MTSSTKAERERIAALDARIAETEAAGYLRGSLRAKARKLLAVTDGAPVAPSERNQ